MSGPPSRVTAPCTPPSPTLCPTHPGTIYGVRHGRIVLLNGTSSSGKSSIARELLTILDGDPWFHLAVDGFGAMRATKEVAPEAVDGILNRTRMGFHRAVAGNDLVVDRLPAAARTPYRRRPQVTRG
ncbi:chloramphenicol 3-O phosphotransferase [Actinacidiphila alni]|uniref:Chloramphenicol 3-O phosphotransferase n=1 Tax=Actinacidiphila alni TaxID=380248 RepID=A0A1I2K6H1_9ACTN|nr:chloramphenicol 3-O phosphotransferase [Actinacidiphila alni]